MKLYLHFGLPKTGTTALQKYLSSHEYLLSEMGVFYPHDLRDHEGYGHHLLNSSINESPLEAANKLHDICSSNLLPVTLISTEGLSNYLSCDDPKQYLKLLEFINSIDSSSIDLTLLFTVRSIDSYIRSITIQNILYDGLSGKPSLFWSHTIDAVTRLYYNLSELCLVQNVEIFKHSPLVNSQLVEFVTGISKQSALGESINRVEHVSPSDSLIILYMWINSSNIILPADFHSYLRFGKTAQAILDSCFDRLKQSELNETDYLNRWEPCSNLVHSAMGYFKMAWEKHFSFRISSANLPAPDSPSLKLLRSTISNDLSVLLSSKLSYLDYLYEVSRLRNSKSIFCETLKALALSGSQEYGQDFNSILSLQIS